MNNERVRITMSDDGVAEVALVRSDKLNALDAAMFEALRAAIERLQTTPNLRAVVLHGEGRAFCAGLDMASFERMGAGTDVELADLMARTHGLANPAQQVAWGWRQVPVPVIAAVHGVAFGGGLQVALGADIRYVRADARLSVMEVKWGLVPDMAGCVLLTELVRADLVRDLVYTGRIVEGEEAVRLGLATCVADDPLTAARAKAQQIAASSPDAVRAAKRLLVGASPVDAGAVLRAESMEQQRLIGGANQAEAVAAALQRRAPRFTQP